MSGRGGRVCIADSIRELQLTATVPLCEPGDWLCRAKCVAGSATSCLGMAYAADTRASDAAEAVRLYERACLLGEANACTNYAAFIWTNDPADEQLTCARRTFERACAAREPFACGMVGRLMLESTTPPPFAEARKYLEVACDDVSGFPCRVLAKHLESGKLGEYPPGLVPSLLARACAGGDPDGCGEPATAAETFQ
jgi:TPR repeat protein